MELHAADHAERRQRQQAVRPYAPDEEHRRKLTGRHRRDAEPDGGGFAPIRRQRSQPQRGRNRPQRVFLNAARQLAQPLPPRRGLAAVQEDVVVDIRRVSVAERAVRREIDHPRQNRNRHARQKHARAFQRARRAALLQRQRAFDGAQPDHRAEQRIFDRRDTPGQHAAEQQPLCAHRSGAPSVFGIGQRQRRRQQRQTEFLRAVPAHKRAAGHRQRAPDRCRAEREARARPQPQKAVGRIQRRRQRRDFQHIHAPKARIGNAGRQRVNQIEQRSFLLVDVPVEHAPAPHHPPDRQQAVCVIPEVDRVQRRTLGGEQQHQRGQRRAGRQRKPSLLFHASSSS